MRGIWGITVRRPVLCILTSYILGLITALYVEVPVHILLASMALLIIAALFYSKKAGFITLLCLFIIFGLFRGSLFSNHTSLLEPFSENKATVQGIIIGMPQVKPNKADYIIKTKAVRVKNQVYSVEEKLQVTIYPKYGEAEFTPDFKNGNIIQVIGTLKKPSGPRNPKAFDYKGYLSRQDIHFTMSVTEKDITFVKEKDGFTLDMILTRLRQGAEESLDTAIDGSEGGLLKAMLLGQRWLIDPDIKSDFTKVGLAHILAISGLHIGYIVLMLNKLSILFNLKKWTALILKSAILITYCLMVGAAPSVVRAVIVAVIYFLGDALGRKSDTINSAASAALLILLIKPMEVLDVGFQLSFISVSVIALLYKSINKRLTFLPRKIAALLSVTLAAQLGTLPLTAYYFNIASPIALLINFIIIPVTGIVVLGGFLLIPLTQITPTLGTFAALPIKSLSAIIIWITSYSANNIPFAFIPVVSPSILLILIFYTLLWLLSGERPSIITKPYKACAVVIGAYLIVQLTISIAKPNNLEITFLDVGQGDSTYIKTPDNKHILIDGGGLRGFNIGEETVMTYLLKNGVSSLDLVVMSHNHEDHIGGLIPLVNQLKVRNFMEHPPTEFSESYIALKTIIAEKNINVIPASRGRSYTIGRDVKIHVLYPDGIASSSYSQENENNNSLVILLEYKDAAVIFTGDIEKPVENYLSGKINREVDIIKIPHHGSSTSSTESFLEALSPKYGVIQVGSNIFGHPHPVTLERLMEHSIKVYRNDTQGAVICTLKSNGWYIKTMLDK